jgi:hypothetical protein
LKRQAGVEDVLGRGAKVEVFGSGSADFAESTEKRHHEVAGPCRVILDECDGNPLGAEVGKDLCGSLGRDHAEFGLRLSEGPLDIHPCADEVWLTPNGAHCSRRNGASKELGIERDHQRSSANLLLRARPWLENGVAPAWWRCRSIGNPRAALQPTRARRASDPRIPHGIDLLAQIRRSQLFDAEPFNSPIEYRTDNIGAQVD